MKFSRRASVDAFFRKNSLELAQDEGQLYPNCDGDIWLRSCEQETREPLETKIMGEIPNWLSGVMFRNGPGSLKVGDAEFQHIFDSSALLQRFEIKNGSVTYQNSFLKSEAYERNKRAGKVVMAGFGTKATSDPHQSAYQRFASKFSITESLADNAMTSVCPFGDEIYALSDVPVMYRINKKTLDTEKRINLYDGIALLNQTSHPHVMEDGSVYNLGMTLKNLKLHHSIVHFPYSSKSEEMFEAARVVASIPSRFPTQPSYIHTFGLTENYFVVIEQPLLVSVPSLLKGKLNGDPIVNSLRWHGDEHAQINVISRKTGKVFRKFMANAFFFMQIINQYEENDRIVLDICCYKDPSIIKCMYVKTMKNMQQNPEYANMFRARPMRFVLPLIEGFESQDVHNRSMFQPYKEKIKEVVSDQERLFVQPELLCDVTCEMPGINKEKRLGTFYRYFYAITSEIDAENPSMLIKVDTIEKTKATWCESNCYPSKPIFVPSPNAKEEDDGVVMASMIWGGADANRVGLIILDAKTFKELGRAEFQTSGPVPNSLHGWFLKAKEEIKNRAEL